MTSDNISNKVENSHNQNRNPCHFKNHANFPFKLGNNILILINSLADVIYFIFNF